MIELFESESIILVMTVTPGPCRAETRRIVVQWPQRIPRLRRRLRTRMSPRFESLIASASGMVMVSLSNEDDSNDILRAGPSPAA